MFSQYATIHFGEPLTLKPGEPCPAHLPLCRVSNLGAVCNEVDTLTKVTINATMNAGNEDDNAAKMKGRKHHKNHIKQRCPFQIHEMFNQISWSLPRRAARNFPRWCENICGKIRWLFGGSANQSRNSGFKMCKRFKPANSNWLVVWNIFCFPIYRE